VAATERALDWTKRAAQAASDKKATDIVAIDVSEKLAITDVFLILTGSNDRQVKAIADAVEEAMRKSRGCFLQNHGLMTVGKSLRDAASRAMNLEETAKIVLYCKQFGGEMALLPDEWVDRLASIADFI